MPFIMGSNYAQGPTQRNRHNSDGSAGDSCCGFCKRNREPVSVYTSHRLKNELGQVTCPQLFKYRCELCGSTGVDAHTRSYCPSVAGFREARLRASSNQSSSSRGDRQRNQPQQQQQPSSQADPTGEPTSSEQENGKRHEAGDEQDSDEELKFEIELGLPRMMTNMGLVSNSRYNSAGRLRNPHRHYNHNRNKPNYYHQQGRNFRQARQLQPQNQPQYRAPLPQAANGNNNNYIDDEQASAKEQSPSNNGNQRRRQ